MLKIYLSHRISGGGVEGVDAQKINCKEAVTVGKFIQDSFPKTVDVYIPGGATEEFVRRAYAREYLTVEQILKVDCEIIDACDLVLVYVPEVDTLQGGRKVEFDHARETGKPVFVFDKVEKAVAFVENYMVGH
jgi:nucleoside 2-deoxyribosyltransferase